MKKLFLSITVAAAALFAGCQKNEIAGGDNTANGGSTFELVAEIAQTKTTLDAEYNVAWEEDDVIYVVTTDETWGKPYSNDNPGDETIADFTYSDGKFTTEQTGLEEGKEYTFNAMYTTQSQRSYHRGASTTHKLSSTQSQDCSDPTAHLKENDALVGTFTATMPMEGPAQVTMSHLYTMMKVDVVNNTGAALDVTKFEMTAAGADLAGVFYVDFENLKIKDTKSGASETVAVNVKNGTVAANGKLSVYFVMAPLSAYAGDVTFKVTDAAGKTYTQTANKSALTFEAGEYNTTSYTIEKADVVEPEELPFEETFAQSLGDFVVEGDAVWTFDAKYGAKASAFNGSAFASESYLVSPVITLEGKENVKMSFEHAGNYFGTKENEATLWVRVLDGEWEQLTIPNYFTSWTFVNSGEIDLSKYAGKKIQIGFKYTSTDSKAGTWEIKNVKVSEGTVPPVIMGVENPETIAAEGADVTVTYSITNSVEGVSLTAVTDVEWITNIDCSVAGEVSFTVAANGGSARSGIVTLSYTGAEDVDVVVSQSASSTSEDVTITTTIGDLGLTDAKQYKTIKLNEVITATAQGSGQNTGKYYNNGKNWRLYQTESPTLTISAADGYTIKSVKITYTPNNNGVLTYNSSNIASETVVDVNDSSISFGVGNTGTAKNGQVRITEIEVAYQ